MDTIRFLLPAFGLPLLVASLFSLAAASRPATRAGWLGVPVAIPIVFFLWLTSVDEDLALAAGSCIAGFFAGRLPAPDRIIAAALGMAATWLFLWIVPQQGADSPVNWIIALCTAAFAAGAIAAILFRGVRAAVPGRASS